MMLEPFRVSDCALIVRMGGVRDAMNLRELRDRVTSCSGEVLYHHFCETLLRPSFDDPEFRNDLAIWASRDLHSRTLAERLGVLDPYDFDSLEALRTEILDIIDDELAEAHTIPWAKPGQEFHFMRAATVVFDTGNVIESPEALPEGIAAMTLSSVYYHFIDARRRTDTRVDDFTAWMSVDGALAEALCSALREVDFYFLTLRELQADLVRVTAETISKERAQ